MNTIAKQILSKGYLPVPICKQKKIPAMKDWKHFSNERAIGYIKTNHFNYKDIAISLDRNICCIDIDDDKITSSKEIYEKLCQKINDFKNNPTEKNKKWLSYIFFL